MKNKSLKIGAYSTVICVVVIAIAIVVNMLVGAIPTKFTKFDTTGSGIYELSEDTKNIVSGINEDITLYLVCESGKENATINEFLSRYSQANSKITVKTLDPAINPTFKSANETTHDLSKMTPNSVIVSGEKRDVEVSYDSIFYTKYSQEELYQYYMYYGQAPENETYFGGEQAITGAIDNITTEDLPKIYTLDGHGETAIGESYAKYLTTDNYVTDTLTLKTGDGKIPEDADIILINSPASDISSDELSTLSDYVKGGGKLVLVTGFDTESRAFDNLGKLEESFGMKLIDGLAVEGDSKHYYQYPYYLIPNVSTTSAITSEISKNYVMMPLAQAFENTEPMPQGVSVEALLTTSSSAYTAPISDNSISEQRIFEGSYNVGAVATYTEDDITGNFVWFTSKGITDDSIDEYVSGGNSTLFLKTLASLCDKKASVSIAAKTMNSDTLTVTEGSANIWNMLVTVIIPLAVIIIGFGVWLSRRKK